MPKAVLDKPVPDITVQATNDRTFKLSDLKGKQVVLYFYPKDSTSGCTLEGQDFRDHYAQFKKIKTEILGVSRDSLKSHAGFCTKHKFPFDLISDPEEKLCKLFGVIKEKSLYGRKYMGIERSTFLIDHKGVLRKEFRGVKVPGHVAEVLEAARQLSKGK